MATYAFMNPVLPGKASRKRIGLTKEEVWLQQTPMGDFAIVLLGSAGHR